MKPVQVLFDEELLADLDRDEDVREHGRSKVLRRLAASYLEHKRARAIDSQYREGYANGKGLGHEFEPWEEQGSWPDE